LLNGLAFTFVMLDALVCDADINQLPWWERYLG